jgi:hypothetical protein
MARRLDAEALEQFHPETAPHRRPPPALQPHYYCFGLLFFLLCVIVFRVLHLLLLLSLGPRQMPRRIVPPPPPRIEVVHVARCQCSPTSPTVPHRSAVSARRQRVVRAT